MAKDERTGRVDLKAIQASMEQTDEEVVYLRVGPFDVRLRRHPDRLAVQINAFGSVGEALAECEACDADAAEQFAPEGGEGKARTAVSGTVEVRSMLVLSTCHVTHADMTLIEERHLAPDCPIACADDAYGAWLYAPGDEEGLTAVGRFGFSESMRKVMRFARDRGIEFVRLDRDGDQLENAEVDRHDW